MKITFGATEDVTGRGPQRTSTEVRRADSQLPIAYIIGVRVGPKLKKYELRPIPGRPTVGETFHRLADAKSFARKHFEKTP